MKTEYWRELSQSNKKGNTRLRQSLMPLADTRKRQMNAQGGLNKWFWPFVITCKHRTRQLAMILWVSHHALLMYFDFARTENLLDVYVQQGVERFLPPLSPRTTRSRQSYECTSAFLCDNICIFLCWAVCSMPPIELKETSLEIVILSHKDKQLNCGCCKKAVALFVLNL